MVRVFSVLNVARMQAPDTVTFSVAERGWGQSVCECVREGVFMSAFLRGGFIFNGSQEVGRLLRTRGVLG